ncbi:MFS transporter [Streptomyces sp. NPDC056470]|uniref:MFS transporter n=1 Tax=Streptomyces sp. NPDC056470 TaxID=3345831 RepID=UPI0036A88ADA
MSIFVIWGAVPALLLAVQVGEHDEAQKVANLAVITAVGAGCAMIAQPVAGLLSDRTRSRWGRRTPWLLMGTLSGGCALIALGLQATLVGMTICWALVQICYNCAQGPLSAIMPERVPRQARGTFAAFSGAGTMLGLLCGQFMGSALRGAIPLAYTAAAAAAAVIMAAFCVTNRESSSAGLPPIPFSMSGFLRAFRVSPVAHPDFYWAFTGRLLLTMGYTFLTGYQLYILSDYIGLGLDAAAEVLPLVALCTFVPLVLATVVSGPLSDRLGRRRLFIFLSGATLAAGLAVLWAVPTMTGMVVCTLISGVGVGFFQSVDTALITEVLPSEATFARDLGIVNIAATLPQAIAPGVAGVIVVHLGYSSLFPVGIALCLCGASAVWPIRSVR